MKGIAKKIWLLLLTALLLGGCTARPVSPPAETPRPEEALPAAATAAPTAAAEPTTAPTPAEAETPAPTAAPEVQPGSYTYAGEEGTWVLNLKENGTFSLIGGDAIYNGEGWITNFDGTVTTGPTEAAGAAPFFDEFGSSVWRISGTACEPVW